MRTALRVPPIPVFALALAVSILLAPASQAATPDHGDMSPTGATTLTWHGGPFTESTSDPIGADCTNSTCDDFLLNLTGTDASIHKVTVQINWTNPLNDLDLHAFNSAGTEIAVDGQAVGNSEHISFAGAPDIYRISVLVYRAVNESYTAAATLVTGSPEPPNELRTATYNHFDFGFKPEVNLPDQERSPIFIDQDLEPEIEIDRFGTIYIGAIRGVPGGVDFWRSDDGGTSFTFKGQPDGTQSPTPTPNPPPEGGLGGGDVDLALGDPFFVVPPVAGMPGIQSTGRVYVTSLWLGSATMSVSVDRGDHWTPFPFTTAQLDRQWNVARGEKTVYMSLRKLAQAELGQHDIYVAQSDDGGATWPKGSFVQDPATGVGDDVGGNSALQSDGTMLGTFVSRNKRDLYVWRTPKYPAAGPANIPVGTMDAPVFAPNTFDTGLIFHGAGARTTSNRFPIMTVDQGDNIHIVFSDRHDIFLMSCPAGANPTLAVSWTKPVPLNAPGVAGFEFTRTCVLPWVHGGAAGKVAVIWYGTDVAGDPDTPAFETDQVPWKLIYAQVENALADKPDIYIDVASKQGGGVVHKGQICLRGLGCPNGTRELAEYSSLTVDNEGFPNIIYEADIINGVNPPSTAAICFFTKGVNRPLGSSTGVTELDCHDPAVTQSGGWHDIDDVRATDGHYCRNVGANKKNPRAYLEFHYTGTQVDLEIARGPRGGNAEVLIDGTSRGIVSFNRPPSDPLHPDQSGKNDLTFGEFVSFPTSAGAHIFRLNAMNDASSPGDMLYVDGFVITGGAGSGAGNPTENTITFTGTAPAGVLGTPAIVVEHVTTTKRTQLLEGVLEVPEELAGGRELKIFDPLGALIGDAANLLPTGSLQVIPTAPGTYAVAVVNASTAAMPYTLRVVTTNATSGRLAAAMPNSGDTHSHGAIADPVDGQAVMRYALEQAGHVVIRVYDISGRLVRTFAEDQAAGNYGISWDGRLADGRRVPSGIYFYRVALPNGKETVQKTAILR
ncbi:MAG: T9SS type A sorting domain-containing protein [Candidatus Eisenbacteria bacterium]|uniref:T9SS type A sorting domain-containing protein n=1 Tax=Eiseniibacteriota bacterium TaxID=2212470 RepID=A0A538T0T7_UNCEI|nr:MAG: T9SS type A sorting domain-containing protein [Candidatus Eisenbacteria bacterium]